MKRKRLDDPARSLESLMTTWPETIPVFIRHKMLCVGCMVAPFHTVSEACGEYGLNVDEFDTELAATLTRAPRTE